jgi:ATP-dependent DNA helicase PIF1
MLPNVLTLKIGVPIILLRNTNLPRLCNSTRILVKNVMNNIIKVTILNGKFKGEDVLLPRIQMIPTDMPYEFKLCSFRCVSSLQWPLTKHKDNRYKCVNWIWKIHTSHMDSCMWPVHESVNLIIFICVRTRRKNNKYYVSKSTLIK